MEYLTVIVPVYNESKRIDRLKKINQYLRKQKYQSKLVVVDDGSTDDTLKKLKSLQNQFAFKILSYKPNKGRGFAVKKAMLASKGRYKLFLDVDLSTPIEEVAKVIPLLGQFDVVIGSRKIKGALYVIPQPLKRRLMGHVFTYLTKMVLRMNISDFNCGFKCYSDKAARVIFSRTTLERWGLDPESLYIAKKMGLKIKEVPVIWTNDFNSTVKFPRDIYKSFTELFMIIVNDLRNRYTR